MGFFSLRMNVTDYKNDKWNLHFLSIWWLSDKLFEVWKAIIIWSFKWRADRKLHQLMELNRDSRLRQLNFFSHINWWEEEEVMILRASRDINFLTEFSTSYSPRPIISPKSLFLSLEITTGMFDKKNWCQIVKGNTKLW